MSQQRLTKTMLVRNGWTCKELQTHVKLTKNGVTLMYDPEMKDFWTFIGYKIYHFRTVEKLFDILKVLDMTTEIGAFQI